MRTLYKSDIEELDTRYEKLAKDVHLKYFEDMCDPDTFSCGLRNYGGPHCQDHYAAKLRKIAPVFCGSPPTLPSGK
jgi:hypothetical protein